MVRPLRIEYPGAIYPLPGGMPVCLFSRITVTEGNSSSSLGKWSRDINGCVMATASWKIIMVEGNLSLGMRGTNVVYTQRFTDIIV